MTHRLFKKACAGFMLFALTLAAQSAVNLSDPIPTDPELKIGKLANGLTYYIKKNGKPEKRVELRLVVKAGSVLEDDDQQGLAHFTEHMAFNGTTHFKKHELVSYLQSMGVKFGADLNAYTSFDETVYKLPIPTDKKENLETGLLVLEDWAHGVQFNKEDIDAERNIVLEEARLRKGADDRIRRTLNPIQFAGSRYAERSPIGREEIIRTFGPEAIKRFYADWYRPNLMAVVVVGDIDPEEAEKLIQAHFSQLKNPKSERPRPTYPLVPYTNPRALVITDPEATQNLVIVRYPSHPMALEKTGADFRNKLISTLAYDMLAWRFKEASQKPDAPFLNASGRMSRFSTNDYFVATATLGSVGAESAQMP
jgi:zinc protease